jgi:hypothetical protein
MQHHAHPGTFIGALEHLNPGRRGERIVEHHAISPLAQCIRHRRLVEQCAILLFDLVAGMRQALCQLAVVGQQQQPLAVVVEPADRE